MPKLFGAALSALALTLSLPACAKPAPPPREANDADPALWVVKDADTTIYLFGTIHVLKPGLTWFDEAVKTAFDKSDTLVLEMVEPDAATMQRIVFEKGMNPDGPPLIEQLPADKRAAYAKALADAGLPAKSLDRLKPWLAAVTLSVGPLKKLGYAPDNGPEKVLTDTATAEHKRVIGLETAEQQMGYFDGLSIPAQIGFLTSTIDEMPAAEKQMNAMVDDWARGDPDALAREMNDGLKDTPEVATVLLTNRNQAWAGWIAERMKQPGTVFVAVGAGHLAGPQSVQARLAARKLKAVRVIY